MTSAKTCLASIDEMKFKVDRICKISAPTPEIQKEFPEGILDRNHQAKVRFSYIVDVDILDRISKWYRFAPLYSKLAEALEGNVAVIALKMATNGLSSYTDEQFKNNITGGYGLLQFLDARWLREVFRTEHPVAAQNMDFPTEEAEYTIGDLRYLPIADAWVSETAPFCSLQYGLEFPELVFQDFNGKNERDI